MKFLEFFRERIPNMPAPNETTGELVVPCVFHASSGNSLSINCNDGKWKCHSPHCPGFKGGGYKKFERLLKGEIPNVDIRAPFIDAASVDAYHHVLIQSHEALGVLKKKRGLTEATIKRFKLGWDADRYWIPIRDEGGNYVNVRKYKPGAAANKMMPYGAGYNQARLFPVENLTSDWVLLCEGEMDCLLACQLGYPAITTTGGADTWREEFSRLLQGKKIVICYDVDEAGKLGAQRIAIKLLTFTDQVFILRLPLHGTKEEKDLTNYIVDLGHSKEDFDEILENAEQIIAAVSAEQSPEDKVEKVHLSEIGKEHLVGKRVEALVLVAGKDLAPFQVPREIGYTCEGGEKICSGCGIARSGGNLEVKIPEWSPELLRMTNIPSEKLDVILSTLAKVPGGCRKYRHEVKVYANLELIKAIPEIDFSAEHTPYVIRSLYYLGHGLETNRTYRIWAVVMPDPKNQYATALIYKVEPSQDAIEQFKLTHAIVEMLMIFRAGGV